MSKVSLGEIDDELSGITVEGCEECEEDWKLVPKNIEEIGDDLVNAVKGAASGGALGIASALKDAKSATDLVRQGFDIVSQRNGSPEYVVCTNCGHSTDIQTEEENQSIDVEIVDAEED